MVIISPQALEEAYKTIELLFDRIKSISEKAERSEQTVNKKYIIVYWCVRNRMLEITVGHFPTNFSIRPIIICFGQPYLLYIFNVTAISNL